MMIARDNETEKQLRFDFELRMQEDDIIPDPYRTCPQKQSISFYFISFHFLFPLFITPDSLQLGEKYDTSNNMMGDPSGGIQYIK